MERHSRLIAFLCALGLFLAVGVFLIVDIQRLEQRDAALASRGEAPAAASATPSATPAARQSDPRARAEAPSSAPPAAGNGSQALNETLKAASKGDWARVERLLALDGGSASAGSSSNAPESELTGRGKKATAAGDYAKAIETLSAAIAAHPEDADALNHLAFALLREGKVADAQLHVTRSLALAPAHAATWANAAEILAERDNAFASQAALRVAIHLTRDRKRALRFLTQADQSVASAKFRAVIGEVLPEFERIPQARSRAP